MNDSLTPSARADTTALIIEKRDSIVAERAAVLERRAELLARLRRLDRELADCRAAARLFGLDIEFPPDERDEERAVMLRRHEAIQEAERIEEIRRRRNMTMHYIARTETLTPPVLPQRNPLPPVVQSIPKDEHPPEAAVIQKERPSIRQVVLQQLQLAAAKGGKATEIQEYIERTFGEPLHSKTVGMTLYRLSKDGLVRREGHNWFFVPQAAATENPGATNAGAN